MEGPPKGNGGRGLEPGEGEKLWMWKSRVKGNCIGKRAKDIRHIELQSVWCQHRGLFSAFSISFCLWAEIPFWPFFISPLTLASNSDWIAEHPPPSPCPIRSNGHPTDLGLSHCEEQFFDVNWFFKMNLRCYNIVRSFKLLQKGVGGDRKRRKEEKGSEIGQHLSWRRRNNNISFDYQLRVSIPHLVITGSHLRYRGIGAVPLIRMEGVTIARCPSFVKGPPHTSVFRNNMSRWNIELVFRCQWLPTTAGFRIHLMSRIPRLKMLRCEDKFWEWVFVILRNEWHFGE